MNKPHSLPRSVWYFTLWEIVRNVGEMESAATTLRFLQYSDDTTLESTDDQVKTYSVGSLEAGGEVVIGGYI